MFRRNRSRVQKIFMASNRIARKYKKARCRPETTSTSKLGHSASASRLEIPLPIVRNEQKAFPIKITRDQPF